MHSSVGPEYLKPMDGWIHRWVGGWVDGWIERWMGWWHGKIDTYVDRQIIINLQF